METTTLGFIFLTVVLFNQIDAATRYISIPIVPDNPAPIHIQQFDKLNVANSEFLRFLNNKPPASDQVESSKPRILQVFGGSTKSKSIQTINPPAKITVVPPSPTRVVPATRVVPLTTVVPPTRVVPPTTVVPVTTTTTTTTTTAIPDTNPPSIPVQEEPNFTVTILQTPEDQKTVFIPAVLKNQPSDELTEPVTAEIPLQLIASVTTTEGPVELSTPFSTSTSTTEQGRTKPARRRRVRVRISNKSNNGEERKTVVTLPAQNIPDFKPKEIHNAQIYRKTPTLSKEEINEKDKEAAKNARYSFKSNVQDSLSDSAITREETRENGAVEGMYSYSDGFYKRTVRYRADELGYRIISQKVEPLGDGPNPDPDGKATIDIEGVGVINKYSISANDIQKEKKDVKSE